MHRYAPFLLACALSFVAACAQAAVGLTELSGVDDGPVTVYYPTAAAERAERLGPFTLQVARDGAPARGNGRLVVISHGSGGAPWVYANLARVLVDDGFVVALPRHRGDNHTDTSKRGPDSWKLRPAEVSRAIDVVGADARFAPLLTLDKVGMYGMSAGGHTALSLAGGRWSPGQFVRHCEAHIADDFHTCMGLLTRLRGDSWDGLKKAVSLRAIRWKFGDDTWQLHDEPRIRAVVAGVPVAADFDMQSLAKPRVPLGLVTVGLDAWLVPRFHSDQVLAVCSGCERIAHLPNAGHGALLSPPPPAHLLGELELAMLGDPPGFDRTVLPEVDRKIAAFLRKHLLP
ncbi:dienelactone hydrolase [Caenimonas sedimenti]|uniref:Dienelactone hydrolase n=1 Tax=Caenimonas sedimenti TaxID=2596921 RepID=A0A562ZMG7_9BURK|nr:dienelactone hydrolase [Caenimonas sedimenti]TWO69518.1 dienelactone hydrolase [Caenimonas sedimenti]